MKLSTKGRYAVTALADMAIQSRDATARAADLADDSAPLTTLAEISDRQDISLSYLEQLFARLRRAGLVDSVRGPGGGYRLSRDPEEIRIAEIMTAVDETLRATKCQGERGEGCGGGPETCLTHDLWEELSAQVYLYLHGVSLADVIDKKLTPCNAFPNFAALIDEEDIGEPVGARA